MKNLIFLFTLVLFGLSLNAQVDQLKVLQKTEIQKLIDIYGEPESFTVKSGERDPRINIDWETVELNLRYGLSGCSFDLRVHKFCTFTVLEVVDCSDCYSYLWSTGETTNYILVNATGNYRVTVNGYSSAGSACSSTANSTIDQIGTPVPVSISGNTSFCEGGNTHLTANGNGDFCWNTGAKTQTISVTSAGTYTVTVTNGNGCTGTASKTVTIAPSAATASITEFVNPQTGLVTLTSSASSGNIWSNGATTQTINPTLSGIYTVRVQNSFGCLSQPSCGSKVVVSIKTITNTIIVHDTVYLNGGGNNNTNGGLSFNSNIEWNKVTFVANVPNPNNFISYFWDFGDNQTGGGLTVMHQYSQPGTYLVKLRGYFSNGTFIEVSNYVTITVFGKPCNRGGLTIKGQGDGAVFPQSQINSQTKVNVAFELPTGAWDWVWSTGNAGPDAKKGTIVQNSGATVGTHEMFFNYMVGSNNFCHVIKYTIIPGSGVSDTEDETENRSSSSLDKEDVNVFPNPTSGPIQFDLSGQPNGVYLISVMDQTGRQVTKKIVKQE
ncbi:MAG: PKD domain-containing protein [Candidatus Paceibacterota bacterium]